MITFSHVNNYHVAIARLKFDADDVHVESCFESDLGWQVTYVLDQGVDFTGARLNFTSTIYVG